MHPFNAVHGPAERRRYASEIMQEAPMSIKRILIVCEGNTCRSPMAAAIAGAVLGSTAKVQSAGLETSDGLPATRQAKAVMKEMGLDVSRHRSRSIRKTDFV